MGINGINIIKTKPTLVPNSFSYIQNFHLPTKNLTFNLQSRIKPCAVPEKIRYIITNEFEVQLKSTFQVSHLGISAH